jgi:hypothetical protein
MRASWGFCYKLGMAELYIDATKSRSMSVEKGDVNQEELAF